MRWRLWLAISVGAVALLTAGLFIWLLVTPAISPQWIFENDVRQRTLEAWLERQPLGSYPFMSERELLEPNAGIEAVYELAQELKVTLELRLPQSKFAAATSDTDRDGRPEFCDVWGMPIVYIHHKNYERKVTVMPEPGESLELHAQDDGDGKLHNTRSFQIFSLDSGDYDDPLWSTR